MRKEPTGKTWELSELTEERLFLWRRSRIERGEEFRCQFCGHEFRVGDRFKLTFSNLGGEVRSGNPITCEQCAGIDYETRLDIWTKMGNPMYIFGLVKEAENLALKPNTANLPTCICFGSTSPRCPRHGQIS